MMTQQDDGPTRREATLESLRYTLAELCAVLFDEDSLDEVEEIVRDTLQDVLHERGAR